MFAFVVSTETLNASAKTHTMCGDLHFVFAQVKLRWDRIVLNEQVG